eukprot:4604651-Amphidinium_carterae.1
MRAASSIRGSLRDSARDRVCSVEDDNGIQAGIKDQPNTRSFVIDIQSSNETRIWKQLGKSCCVIVKFQLFATSVVKLILAPGVLHAKLGKLGYPLVLAKRSHAVTLHVKIL